MERLPVSMLCATKRDAAMKHRRIEIEPWFERFYLALQQALGAVFVPPNLNHRYFFITHCPVCCCRSGTVRRPRLAPWASAMVSFSCQRRKL